MIRDKIKRITDEARGDEDFRGRLLGTRGAADPVTAFCEVCRERGIDLTAGELFAYGMDMNDSKLRATNGGGSFEIDGWDDVRENILDELARL